MPEMMKCFVMHGIGKVGVMEKPVPRPGPNDAIIRTTAALICTSDTHTVAGAIGERQDLTLGHESVGVIHELGESAAASGLFTVGQRVAISAITPCYACDNCQRGYPSQCGGMFGGWKFANLKDGSFAEYFHVNNAVANLAPIPDGLTDEQARVLLRHALHRIRRGGVCEHSYRRQCSSVFAGAYRHDGDCRGSSLRGGANHWG